jgi:hypothetical protein
MRADAGRQSTTPTCPASASSGWWDAVPVSFASLPAANITALQCRCSFRTWGIALLSPDWLPDISPSVDSVTRPSLAQGSYIQPRKCIPGALEVGLACEALVLDNLNPVSVGVQDEGDILHAAVRQPLLPIDVERLETAAGGLEVVNRDTWGELAKQNELTDIHSHKEDTHKYARTPEAGCCRRGS